MSFLRGLLARGAQAWLQRIRDRHGLETGSAASGIETTPPAEAKILLHVGCGRATMDEIPLAGFRAPEWSEIRLDADATVHPDIVGSMADMRDVEDGSVDALFSSHGIEHLYWHDVPRALAEFRRVLKDDGFAVVTCPDLQAAAEMIAEDRLFETAYESPSGPITPFDMVFSYRPFVEENPEWMSHHCGFTLSTLVDSLRRAGFGAFYGARGAFSLWVIATKQPRSVEQLEAMAASYLPSGARAR